ncbi:MAG: hypothetical protein QXG00_08695, partial [Candidatus Woesearchaeota archaeon]
KEEKVMLFIMGLIIVTTLLTGTKNKYNFGGFLLIGVFFVLFFINKITAKITEIFSPYMLLLGITTILALLVVSKSCKLLSKKPWKNSSKTKAKIIDRIYGFAALVACITGSIFIITFFGNKDCFGWLTMLTSPLLDPITLEKSAVFEIIIFWCISLIAYIIDVFLIVFTIPIIILIINAFYPDTNNI